MINARDIAVSALRDRAGNVSAHLERLLEQERLSPADRALARELALGVVRRKGTLQAVLKAFQKYPGRPMLPPLDEILLVALYQVLVLTRIPDFAAVNEAVEQAARLGQQRQQGVVNAILRSATREVSPPTEGTPPLAANVVPITPSTYRTYNMPIFPDPAANPAGYFSQAFSLPLPLAERWLFRLGSLTKAVQLGYHANSRAPFILRVNRFKTDVTTVLAKLKAQGIDAAAHANGVSIALAEHMNVAELDVFKAGLVQPQDPTATAVVLAADPQPGTKVLDFCAAPGTKTTQMAELMQNKGEILALDVSAEKLKNIEDSCRRMDIGIVKTRLSAEIGSAEPQSFDLVLADVPCSNTGVLARRAESRWRFDERAMGEVTRDQKILAGLASQFVRRGGRLVYSTCSIEPEECGAISRHLAGKFRHLELVDEKLTLPGGAEDPAQWHDGGYYAIFRCR